MHLLLAGLLSTALCNQIFKWSDPYCPYDLTMNTEISTPSIFSCAIYCCRNKNGCSIFAYDELQDVCTMLLHGIQSMDEGIRYTVMEQSVYQSSHEGCDGEYEFDVVSNTCIKAYAIFLSWNDARLRCQEDGGDLVTLTTPQKFDFVSTFINCTRYAFWIGLWNQTWITGEQFDNVYGLHPSTVDFSDDTATMCARLRYKKSIPTTIKGVTCISEKRFLCERLIPN